MRILETKGRRAHKSDTPLQPHETQVICDSCGTIHAVSRKDRDVIADNEGEGFADCKVCNDKIRVVYRRPTQENTHGEKNNPFKSIG